MNLDWIVGDITYSLTDRTNFYFIEYNGFTFAPLHRLSERGPLQDGDTDRGYRLDPRVARLKIGIFGSTYSDFYSKRALLNAIFNPSNTAGSLLFSYDTAERQLDCHCIDIAEGNHNHLWQEFVISLKANDPTWYDPTMNVVYYNISAGADTMEVPTEIPMTVGASSINASQNFTNSGDVATYPQIRIDGPITGCVITNSITGDKLDLTGTTITTGHYYDIDCRYGYKTVEDDAGDNQIANLTDDSDIATFSLEAAPTATGGVNPITVTGTGADENTAVTFRYYDRYVGV
jgi:hypothetical protein